MQREQILYYAIKYRGEYQRIHHAVLQDEVWWERKTEEEYVTILDNNYPDQLRLLKNPPYLLFYKGNISLLKNRSCAVIGSRFPVEYASHYTKEIVQELQKEFTIVSGLAKGIDTLAHQTTYLKGKTIGVIGCGLNIVYPKMNFNLQNEMMNNQLVISEYPKDTKPLKHHFPMRNRIIAALAEFVVVMQASLKSGTLITVNEALELNKEIFVLPYSLDCVEGQGCNYLIQQGASIILEEKNFYK